MARRVKKPPKPKVCRRCGRGPCRLLPGSPVLARCERCGLEGTAFVVLRDKET